MIETTDSCSRCGRVNTWHPDCPICKQLADYKQLIIDLSFAMRILSSNQINDVISFFKIVDDRIVEILKISKEELKQQYEKCKHKMLRDTGLFGNH